MFATNAVQPGAVPTLQYQEHAQKSQVKNIETVQQKNAQQSQQTQQEFPTFCYTTNVNMIGKIGAGPSTSTGGVNITQLTTSDDRTCYIAQPLSYNYALVNQMQIAQNGIQNAISNISFKCDVCGLMFGHLTLLNAHKRIHAQDTDNITVVAAGVNSNNDVTMPPHIQILSSDPNDQQQHHVQIQDTKPIIIDKVQKCITCGGAIANNPKRKGPKLIRCENCIAQDTVDQQRNNQNINTPIFVSEENVKFEVVGVSAAQPANDPLSNTQTTQQNQQQQQRPKPLPGHHPVKKRNLASVTKCQNCNGSGIIFVGGNKNKLNQSNADKPFHCNICGGSFSRYSSLWSHKKLHSGEKNFKCGICGIAFAKAVYLKNHSRIHTGEKPYRCNTCGMQFSQSPHLKNHERTHSGEKPYVCEVCDKGFARHATLWNHRRIHTGEKPYKCEQCGSAFSQAAHLKNHAKVHSGEKPFKCDICTAAFADRFALKRHRGIHDKYGQTAPLPSRIQLNQQDQQQQQSSQQQSTEQQSSQQVVEVELHNVQPL